MKRIDFKEVKKQFEQAGYILLDEDYKSVDKPLTCKDLDGYLYYRTFRSLRKMNKNIANYKHRFSIKNKYYWENIQHFMDINVDNGTILLTTKNEYKGGDDKIAFQCGICGVVFKTSWHGFIGAEHKMCPKCYREQRLHEEYTEKRRNDFSKYKEQAQKLGLAILSKSVLNYKDYIEVEDKEGYKGKMCVATLMKGSSFNRYHKNNPYSIYNLKHFLKANKADCKLLSSQYLGDKQMAKLKCSCGNEYQTSFSHLIHSKKFRCNECTIKQSNIAKAVEEFLKSINIAYIKEYTYKDCRGVGGKMLQFDFYLTDYNACIEVDGIQHFEVVTFGASLEKAIENFKRTQENDKIKNEYCKDKNIPLLRIPYWLIDNSTEYIKEIEHFISLIKCNELSK